MVNRLVSSAFARTETQMRIQSLRTLSVRVRHEWAEPLLVFWRSDKRADHAAEVARHSTIQDIQPEVIASLIRLAPQISIVLH